ncbi:MAG: DUF4900 domain-containing protein [Meiothermus sp.]|nr:DUF4900 domain-containing protein [Meiothermus sp.]
MTKRGAAFVVVLMLIVVIGSISTLMFNRTYSEMRHSAANAGIVQTLMLARGAANVGGNLLTGPVGAELNAVLQQQYSRTNRWAFGGNALGVQPDAAQTANDLGAVAAALQTRVDAVICDPKLSQMAEGVTVTLRVYFTDTSNACGSSRPLPSGIALSRGRFVAGQARSGGGETSSQTYALPFVMVAEATQREYRRNVVFQGEYRFDLGVSSFARYALFTNQHQTETGIPIWFTDRTRFDGPVHTNQNFRFAGKPKFNGQVTSAGCTSPSRTGCTSGTYKRGGIFMGVNGNNVVAPQDMNSATQPDMNGNAPELPSGVNWNEEFIGLPENAEDQSSAASTGGLVLSEAMASLKLYAGTASEQPLTASGSTSGSGWTPEPAPYQYIETCPASGTPCTLYRYGPDKVLYQKNNLTKTWSSVRTGFNGVIFSNHRIENLTGPARSDRSKPATAPPALAQFAELTVVNAGSSSNIGIKGDLKYEKVPCPERLSNGNSPCSNLDADNVLGVYSQDGEIVLGDGTDNSLQDLTIHGVLMSGSRTVRVEGYDTIRPKGAVNLLGGLISNFYGAFGQFNSTGPTSGYGRNFTYDARMLEGKAPPYFPGMKFTAGGTPVVVSFGQREQVY